MANNLISQILDIVLILLTGKKSAPQVVSEQTASVNKTEPPVLSPAVVSVNTAPLGVLWHQIDWNDGKAKISDHFSVHEALFLNSWNASHVPSEDEKQAIKNLADKVDQALAIVAKELNIKASVNVHAWIRPSDANIPGSEWNGKDYNRYIYETQVWKNLTKEEMALKVEPKSAHCTGNAVDFHVIGFEGKENCKKIRDILVPHLEKLGLRMENLDGGWVHLDNKPLVPGKDRFFNP